MEKLIKPGIRSIKGIGNIILKENKKQLISSFADIEKYPEVARIFFLISVKNEYFR